MQKNGRFLFLLSLYPDDSLVASDNTALMIEAVAPIFLRNKLIGTVLAGYLLNNNTNIVEDMKKRTVGMECLILMRDEIISSTFFVKEGLSLVGKDLLLGMDGGNISKIKQMELLGNRYLFAYSASMSVDKNASYTTDIYICHSTPNIFLWINCISFQPDIYYIVFWIVIAFFMGILLDETYFVYRFNRIIISEKTCIVDVKPVRVGSTTGLKSLKAGKLHIPIE